MKILDKSRLFQTSILTCLMMSTGAAVHAQSNDDDVIIVTGTRIVTPGIVSSSPITSVGTQELDLKQTIEVETLFRDLPITIPGDGANVNNGTAGAASINLRGLGTQRTLTMVNGKRLTPYNVNGIVDTQTIPVNLIERIDIVTGGASAVYGSDAMAGAVNFIMKDNYEGVTLDAKAGSDKDGNARTYNLSGLLGANFDEGRGNAVVSLNWSERKPLLLGDRELGLFGISTANGPSAGGVPPEPDPNCSGPNTVLASTGIGSTTSIPTALDLPNQTLQFQNDGTLAPRCSRFNFNPFNYYQTPQERYNLAAFAHYDVSDNIEAYTRLNYSKISVRQQVAPSGIFGLPMEVPLMNPFLSDSARQSILDDVATFLASDSTLTLEGDAGVNDLNNNGMFDLNDSITVPVRRRTLELGTRSTNNDQDAWQFLVGARGDLFDTGWNYDVSYQHGETNFVNVSAGYTNVANIATQLNTVSATQCETPGGTVTNGCVPIDLFGPFGSITDEAAAYGSATGILQQLYSQDILSASVSGPVEFINSPWADTTASMAFGAEYRREAGETIPDECLKLAPASCLGGAGGNTLPIQSSFSVYELFGEAIVPLVQGKSFAEDISLELGYRFSDYKPSGSVHTYKAGASWSITDDFRLRGMYQRASRAPNIGELGAPVTTALGNANFDYCSNGNPNPIDQRLADLCVLTGVTPSRVGLVNDIVSNQVNVFNGTDLAALPEPEKADTITLGFVYQPSFLTDLINPTLAVDYYDIEIKDYINTFTAQEILDACYVLGNQTECAKINRINGTLATTGSGIEQFTTNLDFLRAEGIDFNASAGYDFGNMGQVSADISASVFLTQEAQSNATTGITDCLGKFGFNCNPQPEFLANTRLTWNKGRYTVSALWRHIGSIDIEEAQKANTFDAFESISAFNYFDFTGQFDINEKLTLTGGVRNAFDKQPPLVGNNAGSTAFNNGNTFPSTYDALGRSYTVGLKAKF